MEMKYYWNNKKERAVQAKKHTLEMANKYEKEIAESVKNTYIYSKKPEYDKLDISPYFVLADLESVRAAIEYKRGRTAILNFASYKNPGGKFLNGSIAQEESLCHNSFLYNVLEKFDNNYYAWNRETLNKGLYLNRALYSKDVIFNNKYKFDVLTCAAPNLNPNIKFKLGITQEENYEALKSRIDFLLAIAASQNVETLILGAFGCGVFKQNPEEVANIFVDYLTHSYRNFDKVVFAIPKGINSNNFDIFNKVLKNRTEQIK